MKNLFFVCFLLICSLTAFSQQKMYLKVGGIEGDSQDPDHRGWIDVFAFSGGASNTAVIEPGSGGSTAGKSNIQDYSFTICLDKAVNFLRLGVQKGQIFKDAQFEVARQFPNRDIVYIKILMEDVIISSIAEGGSGGEDKFTLNVSLKFSKYKNTYIPVRSDGTTGAPLMSGWDISASKPY